MVFDDGELNGGVYFSQKRRFGSLGCVFDEKCKLSQIHFLDISRLSGPISDSFDLSKQFSKLILFRRPFHARRASFVSFSLLALRLVAYVFRPKRLPNVALCHMHISCATFYWMVLGT